MTINLSTPSNWPIHFNKPLIIAGPCSAESEEQMLATGNALKSHQNLLFRAGVWKPRTRPNNFEGIGRIGLTWLKIVKEETGLATTTEVANAFHVEEALKQDVDVLWIGARTTVNPFAVQEIANALKGVDIPLMIKNPLNPEVNLWVGAIERFADAGLTKLAAIHRGFFAYNNTKYRNIPQWQLAIELRRRIPGIPMICDPSHIAGKSSLIYEVSQKAIDMNYDGLMIETHINPEKALSDNNQQVTPKQLNEILGKLVVRQAKIEDPVFKSSLDQLRIEIDDLDYELVDVLKRRMNVAEKIGLHKKENKVTILQSNRWEELLKTRIQHGVDNGLTEEFMNKVLKAIHQESINRQTKVMNK
ncbi:MAG: 3-deoxy-7-phosphoheptulonate synthase [Crocinitomicaceae bacterium]|nr:3-deoxy-7-phosphoheptulonate synthase [Crocinitomicaceae bacterium]MEC7813777.1 bifunctional 3-deoxy-7-phosphoheptulonate synthase/chorismate mutase type II [Bacteroidota bacterium]